MCTPIELHIRVTFAIWTRNVLNCGGLLSEFAESKAFRRALENASSRSCSLLSSYNTQTVVDFGSLTLSPFGSSMYPGGVARILFVVDQSGTCSESEGCRNFWDVLLVELR
jgi:hypothetical protein